MSLTGDEPLPYTTFLKILTSNGVIKPQWVNPWIKKYPIDISLLMLFIKPKITFLFFCQKTSHQTDSSNPIECCHYFSGVTWASQITGISIVCSTAYSDKPIWENEKPALLAFVRGPVDSPHKGPVTWKTFPCHDACMLLSWSSQHHS